MSLINRSHRTDRTAEGNGEEALTVVDVVTRSNAGDAFANAKNVEPPRVFTSTTLVLYSFCTVGFLCSTMNGFDASLLSGFLQNEDFKSYFHGTNTGIWVSIVAFLYQIGSIAATPFTGPALDTWGRRRGIFIGAFVVIMGTAVQGTVVYTHDIKQFMAGRFVVGFGAQIASSAGPIYVIEMCHPAHRGVITALFNTFWFTGSIISAGAIRGSLKLAGNSTWLLPLWLQLLCSVIIVTFILFLPESPRWLFVNNQQGRAEAILSRYHGMNDVNSVWVQLQLREYEELLNKNGADKRWWDYSSLYNRASIYRLICAILMNMFGQWTGNAILGLLLSAVLDTAGIRNEIMQTNINLGLACLQLVMAATGAFLVDIVGRRSLLILTNTTLAFIWLGMTVATFLHTQTGSVGAARAIIALICMFDIVFATGITPLQVLYPVEILSFEMRAKGIAVTGLFVDAAGLLNQFAWPVALASIGWRTYIILVFWCLFQALVIYLYFPETRNRTLEELDKIFAARNPRKVSLEKEAFNAASDASSRT